MLRKLGMLIKVCGLSKAGGRQDGGDWYHDDGIDWHAPNARERFNHAPCMSVESSRHATANRFSESFNLS